MRFKIYLLLFLSILVFSCEQNSENRDFKNRKVSFNSGWEFHLNDSLQHQDTVSEDTKWRNIDLPHDWSIEGEFNKNNPAGVGGGALPGGLGWYRKTFSVKAEDSSRLSFVSFDGVYENSEVWINGHYLGKRPNGYIGFDYLLTPYLNYGKKENVMLVKVDNSSQPNSRWYSGSGIYRNVWLITTNKLHIPQWGTFISTPNVSKETASVKLEINIANAYSQSKIAKIKTSILYEGEEITSTSEEVKIEANSEKKITQKATIIDPNLWSVENPQLYKAVTKIMVDGQLLDSYETNFGIRDFHFDTEKGFILNGERVKIKGVCLHHDLGPLGTAVNRRAIERQLEILKEMGTNGIRTSHNPPAPELLELCDKMGFIVMDEAFDMWEESKTAYDYSKNWEKWHEEDLKDQILRDRNHPSVFVWSIGNEIIEQWNERGAEIARELADFTHKLDPTRPVTAAMNPPNEGNKIAYSGALDIIGYNYAHETYTQHPEVFPNTPFIATETTSALETRGYYEFPSDTFKIWPVSWDKIFTEGNPDNTISAFDQVRTPWGSTHEATWKVIKKHDYLSGFFIWTGFDYIGEPTPYIWPSRSSYFGIIDLAGFPKDVYYMYKSEWTHENVLHLLPHWNWEKGQTVDVWAYYNNADEVELFLNGKSMGTKRKQGDDLHVMWRFPFEAGTLKAISRKNGSVVKETEIKTAGQPAKLNLKADREKIKADGKDLCFVTVTITDKDGTLAPRADDLIKFSLKGDGEIVGVASGDPVNHESFKGTQHKAMNGKCLVVIKASENPGDLELIASSDKLAAATIKIEMENEL
ncbi:glycoside hydrolase family 2 [Christiangramia fulva]|uniref:Glycoside hydrolase family 2 n=1 Tax=Christiangramia fulva TaxID=2126553 RepID=A0A2R3Z142_9FLAO|nr:beta-galactosidase GalB [Christiangramia fulva]AVR43987.1 glycoside hydrolase family 2 [Christiangramia fulva]